MTGHPSSKKLDKQHKQEAPSSLYSYTCIHVDPCTTRKLVILLCIRDGSLFMGMTGSGKKRPGLRKFYLCDNGLWVNQLPIRLGLEKKVQKNIIP